MQTIIEIYNVFIIFLKLFCDVFKKASSRRNLTIISFLSLKFFFNYFANIIFPWLLRYILYIYFLTKLHRPGNVFQASSTFLKGQSYFFSFRLSGFQRWQKASLGSFRLLKEVLTSGGGQLRQQIQSCCVSFPW